MDSRMRTHAHRCLARMKRTLKIALILAFILQAAVAAEPESDSLYQDSASLEMSTASRGYRSPAAAMALTLVHPGAGHFYLGDKKQAVGLTVAGVIQKAALVVTMVDGWPRASDSYESSFEILIDDPAFMLASIWYQNTWSWSLFAAGRDARVFNGNRGYRYPVPDITLREATLAPVNPSVVFQPEVFLGVAGMMGAGALVSYVLMGERFASPDGILFEREKQNFMGREMPVAPATVLGELYYAALFAPVGVGEEAFFRGYMQTSLSEARGRIPGWLWSSLVFGLAHAPNALLLETKQERIDYLAYGLPYLTLAGVYLGWVYMHNDFSLAESIAVHFWYDFLISTLDFMLNPDDQMFVVRATVALPRMRF